MLRFLDSFDHYATADIAEKWPTITGSPAIDTGNKRTGRASMNIDGNAWAVERVFDAQGTWVIGSGILIDAFANAGGTGGPAVLSGATIQVWWRIDPATRTLKVYRGTGTGTVLGTGTTVFNVAQWYFIEFKVAVHASAGTIDVKVNGVTELALTAQNTSATGVATADRVQLRGTADGINFDDLYICDGTGTRNNTFLGDGRCECLNPNADSTAAGTNSWTCSTGTDKYALEDDTTPNGDTDYNSGTAAAQKQLFGMSNLSGPTQSVKGLQCVTIARFDDGGPHTLSQTVRPSVANTSGTAASLTSAYAAYPTIFETNPETSVAWTVAGVNAMYGGHTMES